MYNIYKMFKKQKIMIVLSLINQPNFMFIANEIPKTIFQLVEITNNQFHFTVVNLFWVSDSE